MEKIYVRFANRSRPNAVFFF